MQLLRYEKYTVKILNRTDRSEQTVQTQNRPQGYKKIFMLNLVEHEILNFVSTKILRNSGVFLRSDKHRMLFFPLINVKMPTIVDILTFMSKKNFMLS